MSISETDAAGESLSLKFLQLDSFGIYNINSLDIEYFAYGHSKAQEQYGFHNPADMDKVIEELEKK